MEISDKTFRKSCYHICNKISPLKFESVKKKMMLFQGRKQPKYR